MTILVTGASGYIGSHMCAALLENDYDIVGLDNFSNSSPQVVDVVKDLYHKKFEFHEGDILDKYFLESIFGKYDIECVIHFAALKSVEQSINNPDIYYKNNVNGTLNLIESMLKHGVKNIIFSSSATVYGNPQYLPIDESHNVEPINPYGRTKVYIEQILKDLSKSDINLSVTCLRYFNPVGSHPSNLLGELPIETPSNLMPYITMVANGKLNHLNIFGDDYNTPDGTGIRDYIHIMDLVEGHISALKYNLEHRKNFDIFNLGTGRGYSVKEVVETYEKVSSKKINIKIKERRKGDVAECYAKVEKANDSLGWDAKRSLEDMCRSAWEFSVTNEQ